MVWPKLPTAIPNLLLAIWPDSVPTKFKVGDRIIVELKHGVIISVRQGTLIQNRPTYIIKYDDGTINHHIDPNIILE
jgi:hypothetical protein